MTDWASNTTPSEIAKTLRAATTVAIFTHMKPDGDAAGSALALTRAINLMPGHRAEAVFGGPMPPWISLIARPTPFRIWEKKEGRENAGPPPFEPDAIIVIDTGSWTQLEAFKEYLAPRAAKTIVIDHHRRGDADVGDKRWIDVGAAAVCQQAAGLCCLLLGTMPENLPPEVAAACYLGLATDTGWFRHSNVSADVMRLAGDLLEAGVDASAMYQTIEQQDTIGRLKLMSKALGSLEILGEQGQIGLMTLTKDDFAAAGAKSTDAGGIIDLPQTIAAVQVAVLMTEGDPAEYGLPAGSPMTKISMRSKTDAIDVDQACRTMGGGGHKRAAGAKVAATIAETKARILHALPR